MEIPAKLVIRKMEDELTKLKESLDHTEAGGTSSSASYREHAQALKTYCDLLLDSGSSRLQPPPNVQRASVDDVVARMSEGVAAKKSDPRPGNYSAGSDSGSSSGAKRTVESDSGTSARSKKSTESIYDEGDEPNSDSLFDF